MGSCISTNYNDSSPLLTAKVITLNGSLREYSITVTASEVLQMETSTSLTCFVCNSDNLYYDEFIQPMVSKEELQLGQIYFILPKDRLQYRLSASDMAAMAVKASSAFITTTSNKAGKRCKKIRISPDDGQFDGVKRYEKPPVTVGINRSGSVKKLHRGASRRAMLAIRSFKMRLSTIHEGSVAD